jgi:intracellular sulfur oxidation DsrE/DsrF family protein
MDRKESAASPERRSFLARLNAGTAAFAALALGSAAKGQVKASPAARWEPVRHDKDDWLDQLPGKHRVIFDTSNAAKLGDALLFANNFLRVNRSEYGVQNGDLAVVIVVRHRSAPFGYNDAMWAKYGSGVAEHAAFEDPKSKGTPKINVFNSSDYGNLLGNRGTTLEALAKQGVQIAVCASATRAVAGEIVRAAGGDANAIFADLSANLVSNARLVPAGVIAVSRAQERGYTLISG